MLHKATITKPTYGIRPNAGGWLVSQWITGPDGKRTSVPAARFPERHQAWREAARLTDLAKP